MSVEQMIKDATAAKIVTTKGRYLGRVLKGTNGKYFTVAGVRDGLLIGETYDTIDAAAADDIVKQAHEAAKAARTKWQIDMEMFYDLLNADHSCDEDGPWVGFYSGTTLLALVPTGNCPDTLSVMEGVWKTQTTAYKALLEYGATMGWHVKHYESGDEYLGEPPEVRQTVYPEEDFDE